jgi:hypothetical protein
VTPPQSVRPGDGDPERPEVVDRAILAERRARRAELGEQMQARRAAEAEALVGDLTGQLARLESELERARGEPSGEDERLAGAQRELRAAEQRAHAERHRRLEAAEEATARLREAHAEASRARERARAAEEARRQLASEVEQLRRRLAEAEQAAAAAETARRRAEEARAAGERPATSPILPGALDRERVLTALSGVAPGENGPGRQGEGLEPVGLEAERRLLAAASEAARGERLLAAARELAADVARRLEAERVPQRDDGRLEVERAARRQAEAELERQREVTMRVRAALDAVRAELAELRLRAPAPAPVDLAALAAKAAPLSPADPPQADVIPERLEAARARLQAAVPEEEPERERQPVAPASRDASAWLARAFSGLAHADAELAGRAVLAMLPALGTVVDRELGFVLRLRDGEDLAVEAHPGRASITGRAAAPPGFRPRFRLRASHEGLGRFVSAASVGSWLMPPGRVRLRGHRRDAEVLRALVRAPLGFAELAAAGVLLEPRLAYGLLAHAIVPAWTAGHSFAILHETTGPLGGRAYVSVRDGRPLEVSAEALEGRPAATVSCSPPALLPLLAGAPLPAGERASIKGEAASVSLLQGWIARAQSAPPL